MEWKNEITMEREERRKTSNTWNGLWFKMYIEIWPNQLNPVNTNNIKCIYDQSFCIAHSTNRVDRVDSGPTNGQNKQIAKLKTFPTFSAIHLIAKIQIGEVSHSLVRTDRTWIKVWKVICFTIAILFADNGFIWSLSAVPSGLRKPIDPNSKRNIQRSTGKSAFYFEGSHFRWLENKGIDAAYHILIILFYNHLK